MSLSLFRNDGCTPDEFQRSLQDPTITCLTRRDTVGLAIAVEAGFLSLAAICYLFAVIIRNVIWRMRHVSQDKLRLFHQPMDLLIFSLICADIVQALGMILNLKWVVEGKVEVGRFCSAQGLIKAIGAATVALSTLTIALYTFLGVWMMRDVSSMMITLGSVVAIWVFDIILISIGFGVNHASDSGNLSFMVPTPYWCWINKNYIEWRVLSEYLWMWITLLFSILVYIPLYLWMRGNLAFNDLIWWKCHFRHAVLSDVDQRSRRRRALVMLAYPLVYCLLILPLSIVRWITFVQPGTYIPAGATLAVTAVFGLSGFLNVCLIMTTRPKSGLFGQLMLISPALPPSVSEQFHDGEEQSLEGDHGPVRLP